MSVFLDSSLQCITGQSGQFELMSNPLGETLVLKYFGYQTYYLPLKSMSSTTDTVHFVAQLVPEQNLLPTAPVTAKAEEMVFKEDFLTELLDYYLVGQDQVLLLVREKRKHALILTDESGKPLDKFWLPKNEVYHALHQSCTGNVHVLGQQKAFELWLSNSNIDTMGSYPMTDFYQYIEPCVAKKNGCFFFKRTTDYGQSINYFWIDPKGEIHQLVQILDSNAIKKIQETIADFQQKKLFMVLRPYELDPSIPFNTTPNPYFSVQKEYYPIRLNERNEAIREDLMRNLDPFNDDQLATLTALDAICSDTLFAPLFAFEDSLVLFNHPQKRLMRFSPPKKYEAKSPQPLEGPLGYHEAKGWTKKILIDENLHRAYGCFKTGRKGLTLKEIDLNSGEAKKSYDISVAPYLVEKHKVRNGKLYFIGQPDVTEPNRNLYSIDLYQFSRG